MTVFSKDLTGLSSAIDWAEQTIREDEVAINAATCKCDACLGYKRVRIQALRPLLAAAELIRECFGENPGKEMK